MLVCTNPRCFYSLVQATQLFLPYPSLQGRNIYNTNGVCWRTACNIKSSCQSGPKCINYVVLDNGWQLSLVLCSSINRMWPQLILEFSYRLLTRLIKISNKYYQIIMESAIDIEEETVFYFNNFNLFSPSEINVLCKYKLFMENFIIRLREDWRIQSHLLGKDVVQLRTKQNSEVNLNNFNIFNQFLSDFLMGKIGNQQQYTRYPHKHLQEAFNQNLNRRFPEQSIRGCLAFKSLTLGFFMQGNEVWNKNFKEVRREQKATNSIRAFGKVRKVSKKPVNIRLDCKFSMRSNEFSSVRRGAQRIELISFSQMDNQSQKNEVQNDSKSIWKQITQGDIQEKQLELIKTTIKKTQHQLSQSQVLSNFVCYVDQLKFKSGTKIRVFSLSNQFYLFSFIVWLIFSIKTFFELNADDYIRYVKELMLDNWKQEYYHSVYKFQMTVQRERNKLLDDFSVNLHDDEAVLVKLAERLQTQIKREWQQKIGIMKECFQQEI